MPDRSPLPGMDPWLEPFWPSVHHRLIDRLCDQLSHHLPPGLFADVEVSVYIVDRDGPDDKDRDRLVSDVAVVRSPRPATGAGSAVIGGAVVASPYRIRRPPEPFKQGRVVIRSFHQHEPLVTAIEVLSPTNKLRTTDRRAYVRKRDSYADAGANVVEVDLVRAGRHLIDVPLADVPPALLAPYAAAVRRAHPTDDTDVEYYPMPLRQPLPRLAIPLRRADPDAAIDLQAALDAAYEGGRYGQRIDYARPPTPPLSPDDAAWAAACVAAAGRGADRPV